MFSNPIATYQQVSHDTDVRGSDPHRLIVLLFDGALSALDEAEQRLAEEDTAGKSAAIAKAMAIISDGLAASLNLSAGGELALNLKALYEYMISRLVHANINNDSAAIREVRHLLDEIGGAWREIGLKSKDSANGTP